MSVHNFPHKYVINLKVDGLTLLRQNNVLAQNISFSVNNGEIFHIKGKNGSGKSTLLKMLAGLISTPNELKKIQLICDVADETKISAETNLSSQAKLSAKAAQARDNDDKYYTSNYFTPKDDEYQAKIYFLGHKTVIFEHLSVIEHLEMLELFYKKSKTGFANNRDIKTTLELFDLKKLQFKTADTLSRGQVQRLHLARAFLSQRPIILMDEPLTGLDSTKFEIFQIFIDNHINNGGVIIFSSHESKIPFTLNGEINIDKY